MLVRVYLRRSLGEEQQAASIDTQRAVCERHARAHGLPWLDRVEYRDENQAGDDFTRPGLRCLISESGPGDIVLTYDDSRIGRDALECAMVIRDVVRNRGARLYYTISGTEATAATVIDDVMNVLRGLGAETELVKIRSRTKDSLRQRREEGFAAGLPPYGYSTVLVDPENPTSKKRVEVDAEAVKIVRRIFEAYADGQGTVAIARRLNGEGVPGPRARTRAVGLRSKPRTRVVGPAPGWAPVTIWDLLRRRFYLDGGGRPGLSIVDEALWAHVQEGMAARKTDMRANTRAVKHPLSGGMLRCMCGGAMHIKTDSSRSSQWRRMYYVCGRRTRMATCDNAMHLVADVAERQVAGYLVEHVLPQYEAQIRAQVRVEIQRTAQTRTADVDTLTTEIARLKGEQKRLASAVASTDEPIPELIERMKGNRDLLRRLGANLAVAAAPAIDDVTARRIEEAAVAHLSALRDKLVGDRTKMRDALEAIFPSGLRFIAGDTDGGPWAEGEVSGHSVRTLSGYRTSGAEIWPASRRGGAGIRLAMAIRRTFGKDPSCSNHH